MARFKNITFADDSRYSNLNPPPDGGSGGSGSQNVLPPPPPPKPSPIVYPTIMPYYYPYNPNLYPYLFGEDRIVVTDTESPPVKKRSGDNKNILYLGVVIIGVALLLKAMK